jgi:hypothetical protein
MRRMNISTTDSEVGFRSDECAQQTFSLGALSDDTKSRPQLMESSSLVVRSNENSREHTMVCPKQGGWGEGGVTRLGGALCPNLFENIFLFFSMP